MSEVTFQLSTPFTYSHNGEQVEASFISIFAPNYKQLQHVTPIKSAFMRALISIADSDIAGESDEADIENEANAGQVLQLLYASAEVDMKVVLLNAAELFKSGAALVDGEAKMTQPLIEKMQLDDFEKLVGTYIANFIATSLKDGQ